ncbi:MAG: hypothetical protein CL678_00455 [Bdellovibrionaceae bacterium]|nr:hypothetical protein [Pseudobdellovibrionaceae bacterium]|tara:strand:+ start:2616 stop:2966 length:351 start_codon:yes stop_codon:yes gene_type:complete
MNTALILALASIAVLPPECSDECAVGISGIGEIVNILEPLKHNERCTHYAASIVATDTLKACGHMSLGEALEGCALGTPPKHCFRHRNAAVAVVVVSNIAAVAVWFPLVRMLAKLT